MKVTSPAGEPLACNLNALTTSERERHDALGAKLKEAAIRREELRNGYAFAIDPARVPLSEIAEWVAFESRCCPFLDFGIELRAKGGLLTLRLAGEHREVKAFLTHELRL
jgi:hypothetical protein